MEVQVIDDNLDYNRGFEKYLKEHGLFNRGNNYNTVAVIGCQSSGKSNLILKVLKLLILGTLLNLLFDTQFEILDSSKGRMQTTKGIWMSKSGDGSILIFDIEGTDSKERGEQRLDIGRYGASNYGLLRVIFEVNLKLFSQQSAKKLLFVLRDFDDRGNNFDRIKLTLETDIKNIWSQIYKPEEHTNSLPQDFFQFEYCMLPHKIYEEQKFYEDCSKLKQRFSVDASNTLFPNLQQKNVPMDGLPMFIDKTWETIKTQKELNLPDQRIMVANLRCNELKDEAQEKILPAIQKLKEESDRRLVENFAEKCENLIKTAITHYDEYAHQYDSGVYNKIRKDLVTATTQRLFACFDSQLMMIRHNKFQVFDRELRKMSKRDEVNDQFFECTEKLFNQTMGDFKNLSALLILENTDWGEQVQSHEKELEQQLKSLINNAREKEIDKLQNLTQKASKDQIEQIINGPIYELDPEFWEQIKKPYISELSTIKENCEQILEMGFKCQYEEIQEFLTTLESTIYQFTTDYIKKLFRDINTNLLRKFNKLFKKDEQGKNREWRQIEEEKIRDLFGKCKAELELIITEFKYIKIPRNLNLAIPTERGTTLGGSMLNRSQTVMYPRLLSEEDLNKVKDKFNEDTELVLEEAIRKHHNISSSKIPLWFYLLLLFFAFDNIVSWLSSPFFFYPLMIIGGGLALLYSMGLGPIMVPAARHSINMGLRSANINFHMIALGYDYFFKVIIIGDPCCGKTSLLLRTTLNRRNETYETTIGVDCKSRTFEHKNKKVKLQIWDTAGQERFKTVTTSYYRGTHCCILLFDITNQESFYHLFQWIDQYNFYNDYPQKNIVVVGNKHDLEDERAISRLEIDQFCKKVSRTLVITRKRRRSLKDRSQLVHRAAREIKMVLVSKENKRRVYEYLLKEGVIVVKKDAYLPKHQHLTEVPNLQVMMVVKSLRSKGFLSEVFNWGWSYNFITNKGVAFLVKELGLPADIVPATFKKRRATTAAPKVKGEEGDEKPMRPEEETSGRAPYGRGSR